MTTLEKLIPILEKWAERATLYEQQETEDLCVYDICGGNVDDAYESGLDDGKATLAKELLKLISSEQPTQEGNQDEPSESRTL